MEVVISENHISSYDSGQSKFTLRIITGPYVPRIYKLYIVTKNTIQSGYSGDLTNIEIFFINYLGLFQINYRTLSSKMSEI